MRLSAEDQEAIRATLETMMQAQQAGDWAAAGAMCIEDHLAMPANRPVMVGRQAWVEWMESFDATFTHMSAEVDDIDGRGDLAYLRGTYSEAYVAAEGDEPVEGSGKFLWILRKQPDGTWLVAISIGNSNAPPASD
jgi:uncharacterized protein (TIGR02246 family)